MKAYLAAAAAISLISASSALAQDDSRQQGGQHQWQGRGGQSGQDRQGGGEGRGQWQGRQGGGQQPQAQPPAQPQAQPQAQGQGRGGGQQAQWQGRQGGGQASQRPDWNAYMRNNPDLQRDFQQNQSRPGYSESAQQYAERHWREHGQAEGRNLPQASGQAWQGRQGDDRSVGDRNGGGGRNRWADNNRGDQRGNGDRGYQNRDEQRWGGDRNDRRGDNDRNRWSSNRGWDGRTWQGRDYRRNWTAESRFHVGSYYRPAGWHYQRWSFGEILPSLFWSQSYWLDNYFAYGLPYPPPGTVWVRYGPDALLVDSYSGEIIQVVYNIFY